MTGRKIIDGLREAAAYADMPPTTIVGRDTAAESLRFYAKRFASGKTTRWDLAGHLLDQAATEIEALRGRTEGAAEQQAPTGPRETLEVAAKKVAAALGCEVEGEAGHRIGIQARNVHGELEIVALWNSEGGIWSRLVKLAQDNADLRHDIERHVQIASDLASEPTAAEAEARIVAWLRGRKNSYPDADDIAYDIERGEHAKEQER